MHSKKSFKEELLNESKFLRPRRSDKQRAINGTHARSLAERITGM